MEILRILTATPIPVDPASLTLLILGSAIMLVLGAIRWLRGRFHVVVVIGGRAVLIVALTILVLAYLVTVRTTA